MMNLARRVKKLESLHCDSTGLVPQSDARYAFWEDKLYRLMDGQNIGNVRIPLEVFDRIASSGQGSELEQAP